MNAFESIISKILHLNGYWTQIGYKIHISKEQKRQIGLPTMPRPEVDILGYKPHKNELTWFECKSLLDSPGVSYKAVAGKDRRFSNSLKIFTKEQYRKICSYQLAIQAFKKGLCLENPKIRYCLVAGKIASGSNREKLKELFRERDWILLDEYWVKSQLEEFVQRGYEDDEAIIVAKLFSRIKTPK